MHTLELTMSTTYIGTLLEEMKMTEKSMTTDIAALDPALTERAGEVLEGVTPGPWWTEPEGTIRNDSEGNPRWDLPRIVRYNATGQSVCKAHLIGGKEPDPALANARFIAWCREGVPALLAQNAALRAEVRKSAMDAVSAGCQAQEAWEAQKAAEAKVEKLRAERDALADRLSRAYTERTAAAVAMARFALMGGYPAGIGKDSNENWDDEWRVVLYVETPAGQVSWHIAPGDQHLLAGLPQYSGEWDGTFRSRDGSYCAWDHTAAEAVAEKLRGAADWQEKHRRDAFTRRHIHAPEDPHVAVLCERYGYGAVMDAASRLWARKDSVGAFYIGGCIGIKPDAALTTEADNG